VLEMIERKSEKDSHSDEDYDAERNLNIEKNPNCCHENVIEIAEVLFPYPADKVFEQCENEKKHHKPSQEGMSMKYQFKHEISIIERYFMKYKFKLYFAI
jgi:hypothetical protein